jgi:importin subunit alpha-1
MLVVKSGAVPKFIQLFSSASKEVREQVLWAMGNIAGDGPRLRDMCIDLGLVEAVTGMMQADSSLSLLRTATWTLANLCRGRPAPDFVRVTPIIPYIAQLINHDDEQVCVFVRCLIRVVPMCNELSLDVDTD